MSLTACARTNEFRFDAEEECLYVGETTGRRVTRFRVGADGSLSERESYGPTKVAGGFRDGIAFDTFGNLWGTLIMADRLIAITPEGDLLTILDDGRPGPTARTRCGLARKARHPGRHGRRMAVNLRPGSRALPSAGKDLRTVYIGSLRGARIPYFRSPVAGLPMAHW